MSFDDELAIEFAHAFDVEVIELGVRLGDGITNQGHDFAFLGPAGFRDEREIGQISGQSDPGTDHDVALRASPFEPFAW